MSSEIKSFNMLSAEQIQNNWESFLQIVKDNVPGKRGEILYNFFVEHEERFALMPASGKTSYHNAFPGGYIDHVIRVFHLSHEFSNLWYTSGANTPDEEEISFVALVHDLGKFGDLQHEEYLPQDQDWAKKRGEEYKHNPDIPFMKTAERSLFLLQQLGVKVSHDEYLGIKLHDGLYEESNKSYYISYSEEYRLRSNLAYIVHQADLLACRIEFDNFHSPKPIVKVKPSVTKTELGKLHIPKDDCTATFTATEYNSKPQPKTRIENVLPPPAPKPKIQGGKYAALLNKLK